MTTPQDPPRRRKEKARRTKQLAAWREKKAQAGQAGQTAPIAPETKSVAK